MRASSLTASIVLTVSLAPACQHGAPRDQPPDGVPPSDSAPPPPDSAPPTFVHADGDRLVDGAGHPLLLRAMGLGGWLVPEGYLWGLDGARGDRPRRIEQRITELVGKDQAAAFWTAFRDGFIGEADIARIHELGFNAIRPALDSRLLMPEGQDGFDEQGFATLARLVEWCRTYGVYVVLDMHAAPGGQTGANIDDSVNDTPDLYSDARNQDRLVALWTEIARRYADDPIVLGYDLLNEPIKPGFEKFNGQLWPIYQRVGKAIRTVDTHHVLIVEGAQWANNWSSLHEPFDDNLVYSFHKYWDATNVGSIQGYLDHRGQWHRPVWTGEIGENDDAWYQAAFPLLESHDIGWSFWTWKKLGSDNNPYSVKVPAGWDRIQAYVEDAGKKPSAADAQAILDELIRNIPLAKCDYHDHAVCAVVKCQ